MVVVPEQKVIIPPVRKSPVVMKLIPIAPMSKVIVPSPEVYEKLLIKQTLKRSTKQSQEHVKPVANKVLENHKRDIIPAKVRHDVWLKYHGERSEGMCYCCGITIQRYNAGWHCSHVIADIKGGEEIVDNMRTCCRHCNLSMGDQNLYIYMKEKGLRGPGTKDMDAYIYLHGSQRGDRRTNNWHKK